MGWFTDIRNAAEDFVALPAAPLAALGVPVPVASSALPLLQQIGGLELRVAPSLVTAVTGNPMLGLVTAAAIAAATKESQRRRARQYAADHPARIAAQEDALAGHTVRPHRRRYVRRVRRSH